MEDNHSKNSVPGDSTDLTTVKGEKTGIPKWLMVTVIAMGGRDSRADGYAGSCNSRKILG